jgi:archaemetzincin
LGEDLPLPSKFFSKERGQFPSREFLKILTELDGSSAEVHLGVTDVDLYAPHLNFVFGEASVSSPVAIFSLARLNPEAYGEDPDPSLLLRRALKEAIHELGHVFGLRHCENQSCVMWFSNTLSETDWKGTDFCPHCARLFSSRMAKAA